MRGSLSMTILFAAFLVVAGGCGKGQPAASPDQADGDMSAKSQAELPAQAIMVSSAHGVPFIKVGVGIDELTGVHCFTQVKQPWSVVVPGQQVKLRGKLPERLFGAQLQDCEIVAAGPSPAIKASAESLTAELPADPNGTNVKYKDAHFFIEGTFDEIDNELGGVVYLKGNGKVRVRCAFDLFGEQKQVPSLKRGDRVHVAGQYAHLGVDDEVELHLCLLYDPQQVTPVTALTDDTSDQTPVSFVPRDAIAAVVIHPKRAVASEIGRAFLKLNVVQAGLQRSQVRPDEIDRIIYAMGIPTEESENDFVQFAKPMSRETLLKEEFDDLPYDQVQFNGATYYRYAAQLEADQIDDRPAANKQDVEVLSAGTTTVLAKYPDDFQPDANGHADSSGNGIWVYHFSETQNPTLPQANLRQLNWDTGRKRYQSPLRGKNNTFPSIDERLHPSPDPPLPICSSMRSKACGMPCRKRVRCWVSLNNS